MVAVLRFIVFRVVGPVVIFFAIVYVSAMAMPWITANSYLPGEKLRGPFFVAVVNRERPNQVQLVRHTEIGKFACCYLLPKNRDSWKVDEFDVHGYKVLGSNGQEQLIETDMKSEDYRFWSSYRVNGTVITPLRSRQSNVGDGFVGFLVAIFAMALGNWVIKNTKK